MCLFWTAVFVYLDRFGGRCQVWDMPAVEMSALRISLNIAGLDGTRLVELKAPKKEVISKTQQQGVFQKSWPLHSRESTDRVVSSITQELFSFHIRGQKIS